MSFFKPIKQKIRNGSRKLVKEIEKLKIYCSGGYTKIQPRVFGRAVLTMVHPSIIESEVDTVQEQFKPSLGSLKKRQTMHGKMQDKKSSTSDVAPLFELLLFKLHSRATS